MYSRMLPLLSLCINAAFAMPIDPATNPLAGDPPTLSLALDPQLVPILEMLHLLICNLVHQPW